MKNSVLNSLSLKTKSFRFCYRWGLLIALIVLMMTSLLQSSKKLGSPIINDVFAQSAEPNEPKPVLDAAIDIPVSLNKNQKTTAVPIRNELQSEKNAKNNDVNEANAIKSQWQAKSLEPDSAPQSVRLLKSSETTINLTTRESKEATPSNNQIGSNINNVNSNQNINSANKTNLDGIDSNDNIDEKDVLTESAKSSEPTAESDYDPIQENGVYFEDWAKPKVAIVLTGLLSGYIEPCGCAGMDRMKGGLSRRHSFIQNLKSQGWPVVAIDCGQVSDGFGIQEELKFDMAFNAFRLMDYQAIGIGKSDLRFPAYFLLTFTAPPSATEASPFMSANVGIYGFNDAYLLPYKVINENGLRIGVTSVVCPDQNLQHRDESILLDDPAKKLREILPKLRKENCDKLILIVHGTEQETQNLAKQFVDFDFVLTSDGATIPPDHAKILNGKQQLIEVGEKGKYAIVLGIYDDPAQPLRYQRVALDSRYEQSQEVHLLMQEYQNVLKNLITSKGYKGGLGLNAVESSQKSTLGDYVGSSKCESCHEESYRIWRRNRHSTAWNSLIVTASPIRNFDPECISCHVIGWHGIQNFPYVGGYVSEETTPHLLNVGCESCHGPGSKHIEAELGDNISLQDKIRENMRLGENVKQVCFSCHDNDNSPDFDFDSYYKIIEHKESE